MFIAFSDIKPDIKPLFILIRPIVTFNKIIDRPYNTLMICYKRCNQHFPKGKPFPSQCK